VREKEIQSISTGDTFAEFYKQVKAIKDHHRQYPNEPVENLERTYRRRGMDEPGPSIFPKIDNMFSGEEGFGRFFDLVILHDEYQNLPGVKNARRLAYLQYLDCFDKFTAPTLPMKKQEKMTDAYFKYLGNLADYLDDFWRRTNPMGKIDEALRQFDQEFDELWEKKEIPGWESKDAAKNGSVPQTEGTGEGVWCPFCKAEFKNENVYKSHLSGKKHKRAVEAAKETEDGTESKPPMQSSNTISTTAQHLKERAIAAREFRIQKLAAAMQTQRADTRMNVERKQGMTDRERAQELAALYADNPEGSTTAIKEDSDEDGEEKIYNPLKLPLAWDGKPIPFWLYKLHGLGVEYPCEICGNFVYMGRRAFDKHFNEARHIWGLKALGITNATLFREITSIEDAQNLWTKIQTDKKKEKQGHDNIVQMEDSEGNVMPEKVYHDLRKQGLL
jgi:splicing factor 3A subunit 3